MLHGYKKSRYNIYDNLEFLGLNPYEQKHFCFGEGGSEGNGEGGLDVDSLSTDTPGLSAAEAAAAAAEADAAMSAAGLNAADSPEAAQAAMDAAAANAAGYDLGDYSNAVSQAAPSSNELDALEETGLIGYNDKAALGYLDTIERENRQSDINLARSISDKYGLTPSQVQPGFMQDPSLGPQTMSYRGPGSTNAAVSEIATAAGMLAANLVSMAPGPVGAALGALGFAPRDSFGGLVGQALGQNREDQPSSLSSRVESYMNKDAASQREANIAARGVTANEQASSIDRSQPQSSTDYFDAPQTLSQQVASAPEAYDPAIGMADPAFEGRSGVSYTGSPFSGLPTESFESYMNATTALQEAREQEAAAPYDAYGFSPQDFKSKESAATPEQAPSSATNFFSDIPDGTEIIPRIIPETTTATPTPEPAVEVVRAPVTRTPATDTFSILEKIYGPEVAAQLLPNRIIA